MEYFVLRKVVPLRHANPLHSLGVSRYHPLQQSSNCRGEGVGLAPYLNIPTLNLPARVVEKDALSFSERGLR